MNKTIGIGILGVLLIATFFSSGCIDNIIEPAPTYTVEVECPLSSYIYNGLTYEEVEQIRDSKPFYCFIRIRGYYEQKIK